MAEELFEQAKRELDQAQAAVNDARVLHEGDGTDAGILNRLYYAAFHGAQAVLYVRGTNPSSHGAVRQQFGQHVVLEGDASRADGRLLGTLYDYRREADYGSGTPTVDVDELLTEVDAFVSRMRTLVRKSEGERE